MQNLKNALNQPITIVIKVGTNLLADKECGIQVERVQALAKSICALRSQGLRVALVSSGAIGAGVAALKLQKRPTLIPEKQATAAVGQPLLMEAYENAFRQYNQPIAQILLTKDDFTIRHRYVNARNTFRALFEYGVVPIINENDTVAVEEIKLGDNDNLSALVATLLESTMLIILTDIDGFYDDDPRVNPNAKRIHIVEEITPQIERLARKNISELSTGGMVTKLQAAKRCVQAGITVVIADGRDPSILSAITSGKPVGTVFLPSEKKLPQRKQWIALVSKPVGGIVVDSGAKHAILVKKKSLLPSGIVRVHGTFDAKDIVFIHDEHGTLLGKGITNFSSSEIELIKGKKSSEIESIVGWKAPSEVIHRDNLVIGGV
ncbi:MAG: glutamate 5-kinase [Bacteroidetes bacterium]|nr:glutamate 5-kinase [Bacteroidota bacterium]